MNAVFPAGQGAGSSAPQSGLATMAAVQGARATEDSRLHKAFDNFVGETFYGQMLKAMRQTVGKPAYFDGGRAEEIFTQQLDQVMAQKMAQTGAHKLSDSMYKLFALGRK